MLVPTANQAFEGLSTEVIQGVVVCVGGAGVPNDGRNSCAPCYGPELSLTLLAAKLDSELAIHFLLDSLRDACYLVSRYRPLTRTAET
jgi:hypothetical protein